MLGWSSRDAGRAAPIPPTHRFVDDMDRYARRVFQASISPMFALFVLPVISHYLKAAQGSSIEAGVLP